MLTFEKKEDFQPSGKQENVWLFLKKRLHGIFLPLILVTVTGLFLAVLEAVVPVFYRIFIDRVLIGKREEWMGYLLIAIAVAALFSFLGEALKSICLSRMKTKLGIFLSSSFLWHVLHLPVEFFAQRFAGDIAARQKNNREAADIFCNRIMRILLQLFMVLVYSIVMFYYQPLLMLLGIFVAVLDIVSVRWSAKYYENMTKNIQRDAGKLSGMTSACISMMETIKAGGAEYGFFEKLSGYQARYHNSYLKLRKMNAYLNSIPSLLAGIGNGLMLLFGIYLIFDGTFSVGMLMAFEGYLGLFMESVNDIAASMQSYQELGGIIERMEDVMKYRADVEEEISEKEISGEKLSGSVEMRHISFGYGSFSTPLIQDFSVKAEPGSMIAFAGGSGSGKSTLAKLIAGLYSPLEGEILFDGKKREEFDRYIFTGSVAVVDQSISLFS